MRIQQICSNHLPWSRVILIDVETKIMKTMKKLICLGLSGLALTASAQLTVTNPPLTIYNQNFAVVRDTVPLELKTGVQRRPFLPA